MQDMRTYARQAASGSATADPRVDEPPPSSSCKPKRPYLDLTRHGEHPLASDCESDRGCETTCRQKLWRRSTEKVSKLVHVFREKRIKLGN